MPQDKCNDCSEPSYRSVETKDGRIKLCLDHFYDKVCHVLVPTPHLHADCPGHRVTTSTGNRFLDDKNLNKEIWYDHTK